MSRYIRTMPCVVALTSGILPLTASPVRADVIHVMRDATGTDAPPRWIVSDDYGLAAQLAYHWRSYGTRILIPRDGLFHGGLEEAKEDHAGGVLIVAVQTPVAEVWPEGGPVLQIGALEHPVTGGAVGLTVRHE